MSTNIDVADAVIKTIEAMLALDLAKVHQLLNARLRVEAEIRAESVAVLARELEVLHLRHHHGRAEEPQQRSNRDNNLLSTQQVPGTTEPPS